MVQRCSQIFLGRDDILQDGGQPLRIAVALPGDPTATR